jgi:molecular chaperone GrpE
MSKHNKHKHEEEPQQPAGQAVESAIAENEAVAAQVETNESEAENEQDNSKQLKELQEKVEALEDTKLRLMAEFENFRRRTNKEKADLLQSAGEHIFRDLLPVVDDLERAMDAMEKTEDINAVREGVKLIYQKFVRFLDEQDVHAIETEGATFDTDVHEAVTTIAAGEDKKDKVIDCTKKGYKMGDRVIRFAQVVVGA